MGNITPFIGLDRARAWVDNSCSGPVTVIIAVPQWRGLPAYMVWRTYWSGTFEEVVGERVWEN